METNIPYLIFQKQLYFRGYESTRRYANTSNYLVSLQFTLQRETLGTTQQLFSVLTRYFYNHFSSLRRLEDNAQTSLSGELQKYTKLARV